MRNDLYHEMYIQETTHWWHLRKRGLVMQILPRLLKQQKKSGKLKILDIGCGTGQLMKELSVVGSVYGIDVSQQAIQYCKKRGLSHVVKADASERIPYPAKSFTAVVMLDVLEHIKEDAKVLNEINRVLVPGGVLIITVPAYKFFYSYWDKMLHHERRYSKHELKEKVEAAHLTIIRLTFYNSLILMPAMVMRLVKSGHKAAKEKSDFVSLPPLLNKIVLSAFSIEDRVLQGADVPFGLSLLLIAQKK